jgi:short-subunit dehydrogenase
MDLFRKVVIITGASSGIGAAAAKAFAECGANVVLSSRTESALKEVAEKIGRETTMVVPADVTRREDVAHLIAATTDRFGKVDVLINNAGIGLVSNVSETSNEDIQRVFTVNFFGPLYCLQQVAPVMQSGGGGVIVNVSSKITSIATSGSGGYRASKCALNALSDAARIELRKSNIRVITVFPGLTATDFFAHCCGLQEKKKCESEKRQKGRSAEFVASRIIRAVVNESRVEYMNSISRMTGIFAQMFPAVAEWLVQVKSGIRVK